MMPYQKYPSIYKQHPSQEQIPQVPQTPFDMAYGSSLLPRQLLVGSPFIQVQSPLPSPHHTSFRNAHPSNQNQTPYFIASPISAPKLKFPPESARRRGLNYHATLKRHNSSKNNTNKSLSNNTSASPADERQKIKSSSSSSSSLNESTFDHQPPSQDQHLYYGENGAISSNSSLYNLASQQSSNSTKISNFQISKNPTRSIILLNVNQDLSITEFLNSITFGPIENARIVENYPDQDHQSIVLAFLKIETCLNFYNNILTYLSKFKSSINSPDLSINFITTKKLLPFISNAINNDGATRNVYVGNLKSLKKEITEEFLYNEFSAYGLIDKIDLITKNVNSNDDVSESTENVSESTDTDETPKIDEDEDTKSKSESKDQDQFAFIHFTNISSAIKAVEQLSLSPLWSNTKIFYGTDRCSINNNSLVLRSITDEQDEVISQISEENEDELLQHELYFENHQHHHQQQQRPRLSHAYSHNEYFIPQQFSDEQYVSNALNQKNLTARAVATNAGGSNNAGNRTVHLGNLDPKTKPEDICNVVRGGVLQQIKHFANKKICFLTFIEPVAAAQFFANANIEGITLHGRKLKIGWGNHSGPLPNSISLAVTVGASRNVYIGIKDEDLDNENLKLPTEEILREDFSKFGDIEQINFFKNDRCVFLNFLNISNAIKVVDDANGASSEKFHDYFDNKYRNLKISFGKDRCGNPPKPKKSKKKNKNNNNIKKLNSNVGNDNDKATEGHVEKLSEDFMNSMGITSNSNEKDEVKEKTTEETSVDTSNAFGISTTSTTGDVSEETDIKPIASTDVPKDDDLYDSDTSSEALNIIVSKPETLPYIPSRSSSEEYTARHNDGKKHSRHSKKKQAFSPAMSSRLSSASLNSLGYFPYQEPETYVYRKVPYAAPHPQPQRSFSNVSRGSSRTNLSNYGTPREQHPHLQHNNQQQYYSNGFTTSGSQVMAQYLAQSQHANMIYAANVLNTTDDYGYEDDDAGYYHTGYNGRGGYRRR